MKCFNHKEKIDTITITDRREKNHLTSIWWHFQSYRIAPVLSDTQRNMVALERVGKNQKKARSVKQIDLKSPLTNWYFPLQKTPLFMGKVRTLFLGELRKLYPSHFPRRGFQLWWRYVRQSILVNAHIFSNDLHKSKNLVLLSIYT